MPEATKCIIAAEPSLMQIVHKMLPFNDSTCSTNAKTGNNAINSFVNHKIYQQKYLINDFMLVIRRKLQFRTLQAYLSGTATKTTTTIQQRRRRHFCHSRDGLGTIKYPRKTNQILHSEEHDIDKSATVFPLYFSLTLSFFFFLFVSFSRLPASNDSGCVQWKYVPCV